MPADAVSVALVGADSLEIEQIPAYSGGNGGPIPTYFETGGLESQFIGNSDSSLFKWRPSEFYAVFVLTNRRKWLAFWYSREDLQISRGSSPPSHGLEITLPPVAEAVEVPDFLLLRVGIKFGLRQPRWIASERWTSKRPVYIRATSRDVESAREEALARLQDAQLSIDAGHLDEGARRAAVAISILEQVCFVAALWSEPEGHALEQAFKSYYGLESAAEMRMPEIMESELLKMRAAIGSLKGLESGDK